MSTAIKLVRKRTNDKVAADKKKLADENKKKDQSQAEAQRFRLTDVECCETQDGYASSPFVWS